MRVPGGGKHVGGLKTEKKVSNGLSWSTGGNLMAEMEQHCPQEVAFCVSFSSPCCWDWECSVGSRLCSGACCHLPDIEPEQPS